MAHTLQITDGTTTIDLADTSGSGISLTQFVPPSSDRTATRVGPGLGIYGQRTMVSTMSDQDAKITGNIFDTTNDGVEAQLLALVRMLELARNWEEHRTGSPVRIAWKRQGATNTAYWTITGVKQMPQPLGQQGWLDEEAIGHELSFDMILTLEPAPHAPTDDVIKASTGFTTVYGANTVTTSATRGDMNGPVSLGIQPTAVAAAWTQVYIAQIPGIPDITDYSGVSAVGTTYGSAYQALAYHITPIAFVGSGYVINTSQQHPIRGMVRMRIPTGLAPTAGVSAVQVRLRINLGTSTGTQWVGQWVNFAGPINTWFLVDLGAVPRFSNLQNRIGQSAASYFSTVEMQSSDGTNFTAHADYSTFFAYYGYTRIDGVSLTVGDTLYYEDILSSNSGTYEMPRQDTQVYEANAGILQTNGNRYGRLSRLPGGTTAIFWVQAQSGVSGHSIGDTGNILIEHLPVYNLGLRGAG